MAENNGVQEQVGVPQLYTWLKGVEGKVNRIVKEMDTLKMNFTHKVSELTKEMKLLNTELVQFKRERETFQTKMDIIVKELKMTAGKEEVMTLKKYVDLWNPLHFATQQDVERIMKENMQKNG